MDELSETKRLLLEKMLRGSIPQTPHPIPSTSRSEVDNFTPLSFGQQQLWLLAQLTPDAPVYVECAAVHLPGSLSVPALEQSLHEVLQRHEAWRTSFPVIDGQPVQAVHPFTPFTLPTVDLRHLPAEQREAEAARLAQQALRQPFELANGPLLRFILVRLDDQEHRLFLTLHHIIFDGHSLHQIFLPELHAIYEAYVQGQPSPLPALSLHYADFARWQRQWPESDALAEHLAYWRQQLAQAPALLALPTDHPRPIIPAWRGSTYRFTLSQALTDGLKALSQQEGLTLYMLMIALFQLLLARYTGQADILLGTAISNRNRPDLQALLGFFLNTLVLRTDLSGNPTFHELLQRVRDVVLGAYDHQDMPFELLVKELQPERGAAHNPFFQVLLTLVPPTPALTSGWTLTQMDVETGTAKFDLSLELEDQPDGLAGRFEFNADLFEAETIAHMADHWQTILASVLANPDQHIDELSLLSEAERQQIVIEWNDTAADYEKTCLHGLFEAQVARTPDASAVACEGRQLTYRELDTRADQLARYLRKLGVGPDVLVGVCVERSLDMVVALLGILKSGAAYVPLDPAYPAERITYMLNNSQA
ncbi:MAG: condensation domain-containing protein, partial [Ktedonobacteraceae bacterium]